MADAPVHPLQQALKYLERAYFPRFKRKGQSDSFRFPDPKQIKLDQGTSRLFLPKLGWLRYRNSRNVLGTVKNVTVSANGGKWFVSIQTEREVEPPFPQGGAVGIDLGNARFATLSDGTLPVRAVVMSRRTTARRKPTSSVWHAVSRKTPNWSARSMFYRRDTPG